MVSIVSAIRDISRVREVSAVLVRHGFGEVVGRLGIGSRPKDAVPGESRRNPVSVAQRLRLVLEDLGPSFVKLGQLASTRSDLLPADIIIELRKLQDSAPEISFDEVKKQIELSLGAPIEETFEYFDEKPLAAASIAQVHRARLITADGLVDVVAKVQRPGIAKTISSDVEILHTLAALLERAIPETRVYSPIGLVQQFDQAITAELDFLSEAENARRFAQNFAGSDEIRFPLPYREASSKQVLTLEYLEGGKITDAPSQGHSGPKIARIAFRSMIKQIYEDGFFHADPHPGNVLIGGTHEHPIVGFVDLGMVGRLSPRMRDLTIDVVTACLRRDHEGVADALYAIGTPTKKINMEAYRAEVGMLSEKYLGKQLKDIEMSAMIRDLVRGAVKFGIEIPTDFVMMGKSLMTIEGIGKELDPHFDVYEEAKPLFADLLKKRYSPERIGNELLRRIEKLGGAGYKVPQQVEEVLDDLRVGRLSIQTSDKTRSLAIDTMSRRMMSGAIAGALIVGGSLLLSTHRDIAGYVLFACAFFTLSAHVLFELWGAVRRPQ
jgi:ubiquinone biosynthesis protein